MWYSPPKYQRDIIDVNETFKLLKGELSDEEAKITLAKFLYRNLRFTVELLTGLKLYPDQIINLKGMLESNYTLCVHSRGMGKTSMAAIYAVLQCIFFPKSNVLIAGPTFRTSRFIFNYIEKMVEQPEAQMLLAAMGAKSKRNDIFHWSINGGSIIAIPLNGEKIRGFRANILIIDEFLLMPEDLVEKVLLPYLIVPQDLIRRQKIREIEDRLVSKKLLEDSKRTKFINNAKMIGLSSASFTCEYLYRKYDDYLKKIYEEKDSEDAGKYFVSQISWDGIPNIEERMDKTVIEAAQSNAANSATFKREYGAQFVDGSDGYFSMNKMLACSIPDGENPTLLLSGNKEGKYLLAIDPNASNSEVNDHFAMCVIELDTTDLKKVSGTVVHSYARAGKDLKDHINYLHYLLVNFNIEIIIIDHAGYQFIEAANESEVFRNSNLNLKIFDFSAEKDEEEYEIQLREARKSYNKQSQKIVFTQYFTLDFILKANEWLQACIDYKKIWFGGSIKSNDEAFHKASHVKINQTLIDSEKLDTGETFMGYFIDNQENLIKQTRYQCAAIEVKTTVKGTTTFDLPANMKRTKGANRMRKDSYTTLLLSCWGMQKYGDIMSVNIQQYAATFEPVLIQGTY
jgi:hypothetical protein